MKYQLSAGCGHGGLCGSTSAGSGFKEKAFPFFQHKKGHWPAAFSSVAFNGPDRERAGSALRRLGLARAAARSGRQ